MQLILPSLSAARPIGRPAAWDNRLNGAAVTQDRWDVVHEARCQRDAENIPWECFPGREDRSLSEFSWHLLKVKTHQVTQRDRLRKTVWKVRNMADQTLQRLLSVTAPTS